MKSKLIKLTTNLALSVAMLAFASLPLALLSGCSTTKQTEDLLSAAGFKAQPATTQQQQAHLKSLPAHKVTTVQKNGKQYFVYPDAAHNVLYIGQSAQYQEYQKLLQQRNLAAEQVNPAREMETDFAVWGAW